ncbi:hypothetical protein BJ165DRAFT_217511 [Panaeolus papilionaceus]|nr:hypothetical protein BJ165DRAFT_217511 [Panaeolus papilionaceus]
MFSKLFAIAIVAGSVSSSWAAAASCSRSYTVKAGDYCDKISNEQKVSTFQLAAVNSPAINSDCTNLMPGQELCLGTAGEDCTETYTVIADDSCEGIASAGGFNSTILHLNNPQLTEECDNLYIGEVLCVAKTVQVPPIPATGVVVPVSGPPAQSNQPPAPVTTVLPDSTTPAVPAATESPVNNAPAPAPAPPAANDDDDDCNDDDDDSPANTPTPSNGGDDDDDDCDDDGDDTPVSSVASSVPVNTPAPTKAAAPSSAAPAATSAAAGGDDDDDLPFCDELDL